MKATAAMSLKQLALLAIATAAGVDGASLDFPPIAPSQLRTAVRQSRKQPRPEDKSLVQLAQALELSDFELVILAALRMVETDPAACRMVGTAQAPVAGARPTLGLLAVAFGEFGENEQLVMELACANAFRCGCFVIGSEDAPLPERTISIARPLLDALGQKPSTLPGVSFVSPPKHPMPKAIIESAKNLAQQLAARPGAGLTIRANSENEALSAASLVAQELGARAALIGQDTPPILAAWLLAAHAIPVFHAYAKPGERRVIPDLTPYNGPWLCVTDRDGLVESPSALVLHWKLPTATELERSALWQQNGIAKPTALTAGQSLRIGPRRIARLAAATSAALGGKPETASWPDIAQTLALDAQASLAGLAQRIDDVITTEAFICPQPIAEHMQVLLGRCHLREGLANKLGPAAHARYHAGVRALFHGASGTGKSLAAQWLATSLGLPIYRVDLAAITSKWIGETEKNIGQLLSVAEELDVILLFDEADSLFSSRTDVISANDRHANSQTNYLLQRLENHEGIVVLTSNARERLDSAFTRRLDSIIEFPMPDVAARRLIWRAHVGQGTLTDNEVNHLAAVIDLAGGHIRNLVLSAAVLAKGEAPTLSHVISAAKAEYQKLGRQVPRELELA